jgi:LysR family transcriptional regulator, regulator for bpeEF and oprC
VDRIEQLRIFVRVADRASFSRAADDLEVSRALASQGVATLETRLGVRLLNRTTRRVSLTNDGVEYLQRARRILEELAAADEAVAGGRSRPKGRLRVDVPTAFGRYLLAPALPRFQDQYPDLAVDVQLNDAVADLVADRVDVAVRVGRVTTAGLVARRIATMKLVTCASPDYLARTGLPTALEDLRQHRCIGRLAAGSRRVADWTFQNGAQRLRWRPTCAMTFSLPEAVISAGLAGGGILQTVDLLLGDGLTSGRLKPVLENLAADGPIMSVVFRHADRQSAKVRVFAQFAETLIAQWRARLERGAWQVDAPAARK